ncbi:MAG: acylphosphatase [Thermoplasmatota archaeon]
MATKRVHLLVHGLVQGVWFRESARQTATRLGVKGWVRNTEDGRVEALLEGEAGAVDALVGWFHRGPERARVDEVDAREEPEAGAFTAFEVRT